MLPLIWGATAFLTLWSLLFMTLLIIRRAYAGWVAKRLRRGRSALIKAVIGESGAEGLERRLGSIRLNLLVTAGGDVLDMVSGPEREVLARVMCARGADRILARTARRGSLHQRLRAVGVLGHLPGPGPRGLLRALRDAPGSGAVRIAAAIALAQDGEETVYDAVRGLGRHLLTHPRSDDLMRALAAHDPEGVINVIDDPVLPARFREAASRAISGPLPLDSGALLTPAALLRARP